MRHLSQAERNLLLLVGVLLIFGGIARWSGSRGAESPLADGMAAGSFAELVEDAAGERRRATLRATPLAPGETIALDAASVDELQRLPGIGPAIASRIVEWRAARGGIGAVEELLEIAGIGERTLRRIEPFLHIERPSHRHFAPAAADRVDVNRSDADELVRIPGIGPVLAERLIRSRRNDGPFRDVEDLTRVPGIGPAVAERMESHIEF